MAPVNFLVQPQDLDEINNKLDIVIALLERWDRDRQETNNVTLPIRTTQDPSLEIEIDTVSPVKPTQKRKKRPYVTSDEDGPVKRPAKEKKRAAPKKTIQISEEEEDTPESDNEGPKKHNDDKLPEKPKKLKKKSQGALPRHTETQQKIKLSFAQKSDPSEEPVDDDEFVIEKM